MEVTIRVCRTCQDRTRATREYEVRSEGRVASEDFCEEHGAPFEEVLATAGTRQRVTRPAAPRKTEVKAATRRPRRETAMSVLTPEEIAAKRKV